MFTLCTGCGRTITAGTAMALADSPSKRFEYHGGVCFSFDDELAGQKLFLVSLVLLISVLEKELCTVRDRRKLHYRERLCSKRIEITHSQ